MNLDGLYWQVVKSMAGVMMAGAVTTAYAALGDTLASVAQDGTPVTVLHRLRSVVVTPASGVVSQTVLTPSGIEVQEFSANGTVFALRWAGATVPDLSQLLGTYFPTYRAALVARNPAFRHAPVMVNNTGLIAHSGGHMRAYFGSAYAPTLVPAGLDLSTLGVQP